MPGKQERLTSHRGHEADVCLEQVFFDGSTRLVSAEDQPGEGVCTAGPLLGGKSESTRWASWSSGDHRGLYVSRSNSEVCHLPAMRGGEHETTHVFSVTRFVLRWNDAEGNLGRGRTIYRSGEFCHGKEQKMSEKSGDLEAREVAVYRVN